MIADDTNVLPSHLAAVVANGVQELKAKPLQSLIDHLCARAERMYSRNREFRHGVQREGARGRSYLQAFMRGWAAEWVRDQLPGGQYYATQPDGHRMLCNADGTRSIFDDVDQ